MTVSSSLQHVKELFARKGVERQLYLIWNRMASGSYFPQAVREVEIPKKDGGKRKLGIPTLRDRIAQEVVKSYMEKRIDQRFHKNSYGYRPMRSSHEAIEEVRKNCLIRDWVVDLDISKFFDEIDHDLMLRGVEAMIEEPWVKMYVKRWLEMKVEKADGQQYDEHEHVKFGFLGFSFQPRKAKSKLKPGTSFTAYTAEISLENQKKIREMIRTSINWRNTTMELPDMAEKLNNKLRGWINYFGCYGKKRLRQSLLYLDLRILRWLKQKHRIGTRKASHLLEDYQKSKPDMFYHWQKGYCLNVNKITRAV